MSHRATKQDHQSFCVPVDIAVVQVKQWQLLIISLSIALPPQSNFKTSIPSHIPSGASGRLWDGWDRRISRLRSHTTGGATSASMPQKPFTRSPRAFWMRVVML
ncbi:MAG: hypothetical protein V8S32_02290 [Lachnospiraceae bacterium]